MPWKLFDYFDGVNRFAEWTRTLQKKELGKLNKKLDLLRDHGPSLPPQLLSDTGIAGIKKLRIHGQVELRPHLCAGPLDEEQEFTLLVGAIEQSWELNPTNAGELAASRKTEIKSDPSRRVPHERIIPKPKKRT